MHNGRENRAGDRKQSAQMEAGGVNALSGVPGALDAEMFGQNMLRAYEALGQVVMALAENRQQAGVDRLAAEEVNQAAKSLYAIWHYWVSQPERAQKAQSSLVQQMSETMTHHYARAFGQEGPPGEGNGSAGKDRRFSDKDWDNNPAFSMLRDVYLGFSSWAQTLVDDAGEVDEHTRRKAEFYLRQLIAALAPTNFPLTNPEVLRETLNSGGENLARGLEILAEDITAGKGRLKIRQTDTSQFVLGENIANTPGKVIAQNDLRQLIQYTASTDKVLKRPLLIVPPWINKFYILDLNAQKSFIKWAVEQGHTVFVVSWVNPGKKYMHKGFDDYLREGVIASLDDIETITGEKKINTIGYCVGGTLLAAALAYMAQNRDHRVASATFFTTQVDFTYAGDLKVFIDDEQIAAIEEVMQEQGYFDGSAMANVFNMLRPQDLIWPYVVNNYLKGKEPIPFDLLAWNSDATRMSAANHSFYLRQCYKDNTLARGRMVIDGKTLKLAQIKQPIYMLAAREDHIVPARSAFLGSQMFAAKGANVRFVLAGSGHIAGVINPPIKAKYQYWIGGKVGGELDDWIADAREYPGSWWTDWHIWMLKQHNGEVPAREPGGGKRDPIEDAPGSYVRVGA